MNTIKVYFYKPHPSGHIWNHMVTTYDGPYSHCDVQFGHNNMASSIYMNEEVYFKTRRFANPNYHPPVVLYVNPTSYHNAYSFCEKRYRDKYKCDMLGQLAMAAGLPMNREKYTFCSRHCAEVLQTASVASPKDVDVRNKTPSALYRSIVKNSVFSTNHSTGSLKIPF